MRLAVCAPQADLLSPIIGLVNNELSCMQVGDMNIHQRYAVVISEIDHPVMAIIRRLEQGLRLDLLRPPSERDLSHPYCKIGRWHFLAKSNRAAD